MTTTMPYTPPSIPSTTSHTATAPTSLVTSLHVIYDADGTRTGELVYMAKKLLGLAHCAACDITHGPRREKPEFTALKTTGWLVPVHNIHRDEMDDRMHHAVSGMLPCVVARTSQCDVLVLGPSQLEACQGDVVSFEKAVNSAVAALGLLLPSPEIPVCGLSYIQTHALRKRQVDDRENDDSAYDDAVVPR